jgi:hypothetical protein
MDKTPEAVPSRLDIEGRVATPASIPGATYADMTGLQRSGLKLASWVLGMIGLLAVLLLVLIAVSEYFVHPPEVATTLALIESAAQHYAAASEPETLKQVNDLMLHLAEAHRATRAFWTSYSQFLLMNLLLPVLTSILGYVFGTSRSGSGP